MPSFARAILEMRSSFAFCAISMSEGINCSLCCGTALSLILWARHYKGGAFGRTLTEIKIQAARPAANLGEATPSSLLLRGGEQRPAAEARVHRRRPAFCHFDRAVLELRDLAERIEHRVGEHVRRRFVITERDKHRPRGHSVVGARVERNPAAARFHRDDLPRY